MKVFALTIFAGAFLLFQVQPLIAKFILPWFGGVPAVWTTCMLFFQVFLLAGYAYAHLTARYLSARKQAVLHVALLVTALAFLPIVPSAHWKPGPGADPTWRILLLLTVCLGPPYFVLSSTGSLLQAWSSGLHPGAAPYRLYALSNAGSLLALVSYPFVVEPAVSRSTQARLWSWSFGVFVLLCGWCAWRLWRAAPAVQFENEFATSARLSPAQASVARDSPSALSGAKSCAQTEGQPTPFAKWVWFLLPLCGSVLLLATTGKLCLDVASVPFLWVLPLSLYLLTFILCFDRPAWYARKTFTLLLFPMLGWLCYGMIEAHRKPLLGQIGIYGGSLFLGCLVCHGEVYRLKPAVRHLTSFYLLIAAGGATGGVLVGLVAPVVFRSYAELDWGVWVLTLLLAWIHAREGTVFVVGARRWLLWPIILAGATALGSALWLVDGRPMRGTVFMSRNFYGVLRVIKTIHEDPPSALYRLRNGRINHGMQFVDPRMARVPTTYYYESSGVGLALKYFPRQGQRKVGVVGLGIGTLAAYGRPGDTFRFYEINPEVRRLAEKQFTYLKNCAARVELVTGDARLSLENEPAQQFDLLVLDAFNSDAIPVHLLTQEAFATYFRHLKPDGAIVVHISNEELNLFPVMLGVAKYFHLVLVVIPREDKTDPWWVSGSLWAIVSHNQKFMFSAPIVAAAEGVLPDLNKPILWTDDYASLFQIIDRRPKAIAH